MEDKTINYDDSIVSEINNKDFRLTINASTFSNEFYTVDYIDSIFNALNNCCNTCNSAISNINAYFDNQEATANISQPTLIQLNFLLEGDVDTTVNDVPDEQEETKGNQNNNYYSGSGSSGNSFSQNSDFTSSVIVDGTKLIGAKVILNASIFSISAGGTVAAIIQNGSQIKIIGEENNMYKILYGENFDNIGYISKDSVQGINSDDSLNTEIINAEIVNNTNDSLRVYSSSNLDSSKGDLIKSGTAIKIIGEQSNSYKIIYGDSLDKVGYVTKNYVNKLG